MGEQLLYFINWFEDEIKIREKPQLVHGRNIYTKLKRQEKSKDILNAAVLYKRMAQSKYEIERL